MGKSTPAVPFRSAFRIKPLTSTLQRAGHAPRRALRSRLVTACLNECLESEGSARFPLHEDITYGIEVTLAENRNYMLADGFFRLARQSNSIRLFLRHQAQAERLYRRTLEEFERLKKLRPELLSEPISAEDPPAERQENIPAPPSL
jgi:hypothetical protein